MRLLIPIRTGMAAILELPEPVTSSDWTQMMTVLETMRPGIVRELEERTEKERVR